MPIPHDLAEIRHGLHYHDLTPLQRQVCGRLYGGGPNSVWQDNITLSTPRCVERYVAEMRFRGLAPYEKKFKRHYEITPLPLPG